MARRARGHERATRRDGPGGAGAGTKTTPKAGAKRASGQQSGSTRPAVKTGAAKKAPKKGEVPPKGTKRPGTAAKSRPGKSGAARKGGKKP